MPDMGFITSRISDESNKKLHIAPIERENAKYKLPGTNRALNFAGYGDGRVESWREVRIAAGGAFSASS